jgi:hypothetical protein
MENHTRTRKNTLKIDQIYVKSMTITKYLIKWKNLPVEEVTWEDKFFIQKHP